MSKTREFDTLIVSRTTVDMPSARREVRAFAEDWLEENEPITDTSTFYQTEEYHNDILPHLRVLAGYEDTETGNARYEKMAKVTVEDVHRTYETDSSCVLSELSELFISVISE